MPRVEVTPQMADVFAQHAPALLESTRRVWDYDREILDFKQPMPAGSEWVPEALKRLTWDRSHRLAWNQVLKRWECWQRRDEYGLPPYYIMRLTTHPNFINFLGLCVKACPARPRRYGKYWWAKDPRTTAWEKNYRICKPECPPSCRGVYQAPDQRIVKMMQMCSMTNDNERDSLLGQLVWEETLKAQSLERYYAGMSEAILSDNLNRLLGIKSVGYTPRKIQLAS